MFGLFGKRWEVVDTSGKHSKTEQFRRRKNANIYASEMNEWDEYFPGSVFVVRRINAV